VDAEFNPYAPPKAGDADPPRGDGAPALWNPRAAALWSLLFSPAFGAYLHMRNWQALEDEQRAGAARIWFIVSLAALALSVLVAMVTDHDRLNAPLRWIGLALLISWYHSGARPQIRYVKRAFGADYPRRSWMKPLLTAVGVFLAVMVALTLSVIVQEPF
jgi:hypothetical protein